MTRRWVLPEELPRYINKKLYLPIPESANNPSLRLGVKKLIFNGVARLQDGSYSVVFEFNESDDEQPYTPLSVLPDGVVPIGNYCSYLFRNFWLAYAHGLDWTKHPYNPKDRHRHDNIIDFNVAG